MLDKETLKRCCELAKVCKATYAGPIRHSFYEYEGIPFSHQKIIHGSYGRGYCRIFWNAETVVIAFRGTRESVDWTVSNLKAFPVSLRDCGENSNVRVHRGFQNALDYRDKTTQLRSLDAILAHIREQKLLDRKVVITGHSLGGALAILFAVKIRSAFPAEIKSKLERIVTFGSPAVGLSGFEKFYAELAGKTIRVINNFDAVPFTPPFFYRHIGSEVWLQCGNLIYDQSWLTRFSRAFNIPLSRFSGDHSIALYIEELKKAVECFKFKNSQ
jgi:predicted lipase